MMRISKSPCGIAAVATIIVLAAACRHIDPAAAPVAERNVNYTVPFNTVTFVEPALMRNIIAEQTGSKRSATNTLIAWTLLRNRTDSRVVVSVRARFFDANKAPLDNSSWTPVFLDARSLQAYEIPSTRNDAAYYYIEVNQGR
jgi:hypothetical protein